MQKVDHDIRGGKFISENDKWNFSFLENDYRLIFNFFLFSQTYAPYTMAVNT